MELGIGWIFPAGLIVLCMPAIAVAPAQAQRTVLDCRQAAVPAMGDQAVLVQSQPDGWHISSQDKRKREVPLIQEGTRTDLAGYGELVFDIANNRDEQTMIVLLLRDAETKAGEDTLALFFVPPKWNGPIALPIRHLSYSSSGYAWPPPYARFNPQFWGRTRMGEMVKLSLLVERPTDVVLHTIWVQKPYDPAGWVDQFGQRKEIQFAGKVSDEDQLRWADATEAADLAAHPQLPHRDQYQAWADGPTLKATGFFRLEQVNGRWWFVAPNGHLYYSSAINAAIFGMHAPLDDVSREAYSWLPPNDATFGEAWKGDSVNFVAVNLIRKWGIDYQPKACDRVLDRLASWGFTGVGNWSDESITSLHRMPWFSAGPNNWDPAIPGMKVAMVTNNLVDVFAPNCASEAERIAVASLGKYKDDPWLVGHFISNEVGWDKLIDKILYLPNDQPAKVALLDRLKTKYKTIDALNQAWGSRAASFEALTWPPMKDQQPTRAAWDDMHAFRREFADRWYHMWADATRKADPNHLLLGSRLKDSEREDDIVAIAGKYMDVFSTNAYDRVPDSGILRKWYNLSGRPIILSEFGHYSLDTGLLTTAVPVESQKARGEAFSRYTELAASLPFMVGTHYFQYYDEPITGRSDYETAYNGFVSVADTPYPDLVASARKTHERLYDIHAGKVMP